MWFLFWWIACHIPSDNSWLHWRDKPTSCSVTPSFIGIAIYNISISWLSLRIYSNTVKFCKTNISEIRTGENLLALNMSYVYQMTHLICNEFHRIFTSSKMLPLVITIDPLLYDGQEVNGQWSCILEPTPRLCTEACRIKITFISKCQQHISVNGNLSLKLCESLRGRSEYGGWLQSVWVHGHHPLQQQ